MTEGQIYAWSVVNFALMVGAVAVPLRRMARQFFFARRDRMQKEMISAAHLLRQAKVAASKQRALQQGLAEELEARRAAAAECADGECKALFEDAKRAAENALARAMRQGEEEHIRYRAEIGQRLLAEAFSRAAKKLKTKMTPEVLQRVTARGVTEFSGLLKLSAHEFSRPEGGL